MLFKNVNQTCTNSWIFPAKYTNQISFAKHTRLNVELKVRSAHFYACALTARASALTHPPPRLQERGKREERPAELRGLRGEGGGGWGRYDAAAGEEKGEEPSRLPPAAAMRHFLLTHSFLIPARTQSSFAQAHTAQATHYKPNTLQNATMRAK